MGTPVVRESHSQDRDAGREGSRGVRRQHGISEEDSRSETGCQMVKTMTKDKPAFLVDVGSFIRIL